MPVAGAFQSGVLKILCPSESNEELPAVEPIRMHQKSTQKMYSLVCSPARDPIQVCLSEFRHLIAGAIEVLLRSTRRPLCTAVQTKCGHVCPSVPNESSLQSIPLQVSGEA